MSATKYRFCYHRNIFQRIRTIKDDDKLRIERDGFVCFDMCVGMSRFAKRLVSLVFKSLKERV